MTFPCCVFVIDAFYVILLFAFVPSIDGRFLQGMPTREGNLTMSTFGENEHLLTAQKVITQSS